MLGHDLDDLVAQWEAQWQMKFNVAKCHSMRVTWLTTSKQIKYEYMMCYTIKPWNRLIVPSTLILLHVYQKKMDWGQDISNISSRTAKTIVLLNQNLSLAPRETKEAA